MRTTNLLTAAAILCVATGQAVFTQTPAPAGVTQAPAAVPQAPANAPGASGVASAITPPADYVIGPDDQLSIIFWRDKDMSADVTVRPDGMISIPLVNDIQAVGLTPEELRVSVTKAATKFVEDPTVSVVVKAINSRKVFITGQVAKPNPYPLMGPMTVLQLITMAGGVLEYADADKITVLRTEKGVSTSFRVNYDDLKRGKNIQQNIELKPGDQVLVP